MDELVVRTAMIRPDDRVLDVACGFGGTLARLDRMTPRLELVGINVDPRQLAVARRSLPERVMLVRGDACALPFASARFDRVLCIEAAFHFASRRRFLAEAARVLAPGGRIVLTDFEPAASAAACRPERRARLERGLAGALGDVSRAYREGPHTELAADAGLVVEREEDLTEATLPSYAHMLGGLGAARPPWPRAIVGGLRLLAAASRTGVLRYVLVSLRHAGDAALS
jgi:SAM-dependent methyltransferase